MIKIVDLTSAILMRISYANCPLPPLGRGHLGSRVAPLPWRRSVAR